MYANGEGVPQDDAEAAAWFRKTADQGDASAQSSLDSMYATGQGVPQDSAEAAAWFRKVADQGDALAQSSLGFMYYTGRGIPQDYVEAHKWANLAAERATGDDKKRCTELRDGMAKRMTPAQLAEAQQRAREWQTAFDARQE